ncbi:MAG: response regulator [Alphaproteobacteria bacterium]|nr:response regulator [Alphaproteobacteria bacterium]
MPSTSTALRKRADPRPRYSAARKRKPAILLVDSEAPIRMALSGFLQDCGFKIFETSSAAETLKILKDSAVPLDLVLADVHLPGKIDGFQLAASIRSSYPHIEVMLVAGDANKAKRAEQLCAEEPFFAKPYDLRHVVRVLRATMQKRARKDD